MLKQNDWHLKQMPTLTYVAEFNFTTPLTLDECHQRLLSATKEKSQRGKTHVYEVLNDNRNELFFAAKFALNQSAWYLAGHIKPTGHQKENRVNCYTGLPIVTLIIPFIFLVGVLIFVGLANHLPIIGVLLLFVAILIVFGLVGMRYVRLFRQGMERDIRKFLNADA